MEMVVAQNFCRCLEKVHLVIFERKKMEKFTHLDHNFGFRMHIVLKSYL